MLELNALREFRADEAPTPEARELARRRLETAVADVRRRPRRRLLLALVAALVLLGAGTAFAVARELLVGGPAPPEVKEQAALLNEVKGELIPRVREGPGIRAEETRLAASLDASTGRVYLWLAPTDRGDYCLFEQVVGNELDDGRPNLSGGCGRGGAPIDSRLSGSRVRDNAWLARVYGRVDQPVQRLEVQLRGETHEVPLSGRFFLFELPGVEDGHIPDIELIAYDADGDEVARRKHDVPPGFTRPPRRIDLSGVEPLLEIRTRRTRKPIRLYVVERDGERCKVLVSPGGTGSGCGGRRPEPRDIHVSPNQIGTTPNGMLLLWGEVGSEIERLELRFEDGRVERLSLVEHFTLYQVAREDFVAGRRPVALVGRDTSGEVVGERKLGPWRK